MLIHKIRTISHNIFLQMADANSMWKLEWRRRVAGCSMGTIDCPLSDSGSGCK